MDVRQLRYFVEVVEAKSFTKAAELIRVAQPALGFQVRKLEDELGVDLLVRHSRGVEPTEAGQALLRHAHSILRQIDRARQEVQDLTGPPRGTVSLGVTPTVSALLATRLVQQCSENHPHVSLNLVEAMSEEVMRRLADNRIDMGFTYNPEGARNVHCEPLLTEDLFFIGARRQGKAPSKTITLSAVLKEPLILPSRPHGLRQWVENAARSIGGELAVSFEIDSVATIRELAESGIGRTVLPFGAVQGSVEAGVVFAARITRPRISRTLHLGYASSYLASNASRAVRDVITGVVTERIREGGGYWHAS